MKVFRFKFNGWLIIVILSMCIQTLDSTFMTGLFLWAMGNILGNTVTPGSILRTVKTVSPPTFRSRIKPEDEDYEDNVSDQPQSKIRRFMRQLWPDLDCDVVGEGKCIEKSTPPPIQYGPFGPYRYNGDERLAIVGSESSEERSDESSEEHSFNTRLEDPEDMELEEIVASSPKDVYRIKRRRHKKTRLREKSKKQAKFSTTTSGTRSPRTRQWSTISTPLTKSPTTTFATTSTTPMTSSSTTTTQRVKAEVDPWQNDSEPPDHIYHQIVYPVWPTFHTFSQEFTKHEISDAFIQPVTSAIPSATSTLSATTTTTLKHKQRDKSRNIKIKQKPTIATNPMFYIRPADAYLYEKFRSL